MKYKPTILKPSINRMGIYRKKVPLKFKIWTKAHEEKWVGLEIASTMRELAAWIFLASLTRYPKFSRLAYSSPSSLRTSSSKSSRTNNCPQKGSLMKPTAAGVSHGLLPPMHKTFDVNLRIELDQISAFGWLCSSLRDQIQFGRFTLQSRAFIWRQHWRPTE